MRRPTMVLPIAILLLGACSVLPSGPSVMVLPGTGKNFEQFRSDEALCRQFASAQIGANAPEQLAADSGLRSAALGAALGAVAGAAMDGNRGAAAGAGTGLLMGGLAGAASGQVSAYDAQRRYDYAFMQCMYSKGHRIPVTGSFSAEPSPHAGNMFPPPPPGTPPPPPPGVLPH